MASHSTLIIILVAAGVAALHDGVNPALAAAPLPSKAAKEFLDSHNRARAAVGVPPLRWSEALANATSRTVRYQKNRKKCQFASLDAVKYGANQFILKGSMATPKMAVENWVEEKENYDYGKNTCVKGDKCGVYKQVVWRNSTQLGCAQATCVKDQFVLVICFYFPPGNYDGERPY